MLQICYLREESLLPSLSGGMSLKSRSEFVLIIFYLQRVILTVLWQTKRTEAKLSF